MKKFCLKRVVESVIVLILISFFSFGVIELAPGDISSMYISPTMTEEEKQATIEKLGLDRSMGERYVEWFKGVLQGDFGVSLSNKRPVAEQFAEKLGVATNYISTIERGASFPRYEKLVAISLIISIPLGLIAGLKKNTIIDRIINLIAYIGVSIPSFWLAMVMIIVFSLKLRLLPSSGMHTIGVDSAWDTIKHLIMPAFTLCIGNLATFTRYIRSNTIGQLEEEYVLTAKSKGTSKGKILFRHVLKNCLLPIITLIGMRLASLVVGSFIIESIFGWPGLGTLGMSAIQSRDYPMIMAYTMLSGTILVLGNFLADILYAFADPRIKQGMGEAHGR